MCGFAGILDPSGALDGERPRILDAMTRTLIHRGPDDEGRFLDAHVALGHRRLSIIDLESGRQPIGNEDGSVWVVLNSTLR